MPNKLKFPEFVKRRPVIPAIIAVVLVVAAALAVAVYFSGHSKKAAGMPANSAKAPSAASQSAAPMQLVNKTFHDSALEGSSQIILVTAEKMDTFVARLQTYQKKDGKWYLVMTADSRIGLGGLVYDKERIEGSNTTPVGIYSLPYAFGVNKNPGTKMPYKPIGDNTYYDGQYGSKTYNQLVEGQPDNDEYEYMFSVAYFYGMDIAFNPEQKVGKGNGIFLHCFTDAGHTAGCVSISKENLIKLLKWITPADNPKIIICPESDLSKYFS